MTRFASVFAAAVLGATLWTAPPAQAAEVAYTLEPNHTQVDFRWVHMGMSTPAASFDQVDGTLLWDAQDVSKSSVKVSLPLAGVHTRVPALDGHFKSADFFDMAKYPSVTFASTRVEPQGVGNLYRIYGDLTVRGVTKEVVLDARLNGAGTHPMFKAPMLGFDARTSIKRSDFGMGALVPMVSDQIEIRITTEAVEAQGLKRAMAEMAKAK